MLFNLLQVASLLVSDHGQRLVRDHLGLHEELLEGGLGLLQPELDVFVELFLTLSLGARVSEIKSNVKKYQNPKFCTLPGVARILLDKFLDLLKVGVQRDGLALVQHLAEVFLLLGYQQVHVLVEQAFAVALGETLADIFIPNQDHEKKLVKF